MFKSIKSKIIITSIVMLTVLMFAVSLFALYSRQSTKQLMVQNYKYFIVSEYLEKIYDNIVTLENNLRGLSLIGSLYYKTDHDDDLTYPVITRIFSNYPDTLGGGIWFKPYIIDKNIKYKCFYAFRNKDREIVFDKEFASKKYDYPDQEWYKEIISEVTPERNVVWTKPYYENLGSYTKMITAGTGIYVDGKLVGVATVDWKISDVIENISKIKLKERTFSMYKSGGELKGIFVLFANLNEDSVIATNDPYLDSNSLVGHSLKEIPWYASDLYAKTYIKYHGNIYIPFTKKLPNGTEIIVCVPKSEIFKFVDRFYFPWVFGILFFIFAILALVYYGMNRYIMTPIDKLINIAHKISNGEDANIKIEKPAEFAQLASTYDKMTNDIKTAAKEKEHIVSELNIAKNIQSSSLPSVFPAFPERNEFDIFASMEPAKEVGGDFYDFYFIDENNLVFLIADVSGKGVPAALFMMTVKTLINNLSEMGYEPEKLIEIINKKICETNKQGFFVTMLLCITNVKTGKTSIINCGHNLPLIKRQNGKYEYLKLESNIVLGVFADSEFEIYNTIVNPGDIIYTYTDGVTESTNTNNEMYGEERLYDCLNSIESDDVMTIAQDVKASVKEFADGVLQSDDITMLIFKYNGNQNGVKTFKQFAKKQNYNKFYTWLNNTCTEWNLDKDLTNKIDMCAEEIFANIAFYAYPDKDGTIEAKLEKTENSIIFEFLDNGIKYNPLEKPDPDITLPPEERPIGGLGIYMVKEMTDEISYKRENNKNILTLIFKI